MEWWVKIYIQLDISIVSSQNALVIYKVHIVQTRNTHVHFPAQGGVVLFRFTILMSRQLYIIVLTCISLLVTWDIFSCLLAIYSFFFLRIVCILCSFFYYMLVFLNFFSKNSLYILNSHPLSTIHVEDSFPNQLCDRFHSVFFIS